MRLKSPQQLNGHCRSSAKAQAGSKNYHRRKLFCSLAMEPEEENLLACFGPIMIQAIAFKKKKCTADWQSADGVVRKTLWIAVRLPNQAIRGLAESPVRLFLESDSER